MSKRNAQDSYQAAMLQWECLRDPNRVAEPAPVSADPHAVLRRRDNRTVRVTPVVKAQDTSRRDATRVRRSLRRSA